MSCLFWKLDIERLFNYHFAPIHQDINLNSYPYHTLDRSYLANMAFRIRDAVPSPSNADAQFITSAFDSCIPHLATIGSASQWGTTPLSSARPDFINRHITAIADAEKYGLTRSGSPVRVLIAEGILPNGDYIPVGAATLRGGYFSKYLFEQKHLEEIISKALAGERGGFMFLEILVTDFTETTKACRKGAGAALVKHAKGWAKELGLGVMYVDCWSGNDGKLVKYVIAFPLPLISCKKETVKC